MKPAIELIGVIAALPFTAAAAYLAILGILALLPGDRRVPAARTLRRFAILVPAHDEERLIPALLDSLRGLDYPSDRVSVTVVADNCHDATAAAARAAAALVHERHDEGRVGKGYALAFGLAQFGAAHDAVVFIDADCTVSPNLLRVFNDHLEAGDEVVQAFYSMAISRESSTRPLRELALSLVHRVRPLAKERFGGSAGLKGSGMCFSRAAIERLAWTASGLAEDVEQHARLVRLGMRVAFAPDASVVGRAPATLGESRRQHSRWEAGRLSAAWRQAPTLLADGIRQPSLVKLDTAVELLVPPISVLACGLLAFLAGGVALGSPALTLCAGAGTGALTLYLGAGIASARPRPVDFVRAVAAAPLYVIWKTALYARALLARPAAWEPTRRGHAESGEPAATGPNPHVKSGG